MTIGGEVRNAIDKLGGHWFARVAGLVRSLKA